MESENNAFIKGGDTSTKMKHDTLVGRPRLCKE